MARFDRYLLSQLLMLFGFFSLVLVLIYWINQAVRLFDQLIADGQSAWVFLEFTALSLPGVIRIVLPLAAFAASLYVTNRMTTDSELVVVQATGYSAFRLARPVFMFGLIVTGLMLILMHVLVPASTRQYNDRENDVRQNLTARLLTEGQFLNPSPGVTFYIRDITTEGELLDIFLSDSRSDAETLTYTASQAYLIRTDNGPQLVMVDGMAQALSARTGRLITTRFEDFAYDIGSLITTSARSGRSSRELSTWDLLNPTPALVAETGKTAGALVVEGHDRTGQAILATAAAMLGFSTLVLAGFSRFGVWRQMVAAIFLVIFVKGMETTGANMARTDPSLWFMTYLPSVVAFGIIWFQLFWATKPALFRRRRQGVAA